MATPSECTTAEQKNSEKSLCSDRRGRPRWGDNISAHRREPDTMEEARARACLWTVSSSAGLLCMCTGEAIAKAVAAALAGETVTVDACSNTDRRQLSLLGGKVA